MVPEPRYAMVPGRFRVRPCGHWASGRVLIARKACFPPAQRRRHGAEAIPRTTEGGRRPPGGPTGLLRSEFSVEHCGVPRIRTGTPYSIDLQDGPPCRLVALVADLGLDLPDLLCVSVRAFYGSAHGEGTLVIHVTDGTGRGVVS